MCPADLARSYESSVGMAMAETDAEIVLHTTPLPREWGVHYLVEDVSAAVDRCHRQGCIVREPPFDVAIGKVRRARRSVRQHPVHLGHEQRPKARARGEQPRRVSPAAIPAACSPPAAAAR